MSTKVIFFDIDGTLLSTAGAGQRAMELALVQDFQIEFPFDGVLTAGRTDRGITDEIFGRYRLKNTDQNRRRFREAYLTHLRSSLKEQPGLLLPQVRELLELLSAEKSVTLSLLTGNYADGAWIKLRHFQLDHYFRSGGFGDDHPDRDDVARGAVDAVSRALQKVVRGSDSVVIGDTPADIRCARAIGARAVAVATGGYSANDLNSHTPDHLFADFSETAVAVRRILELL
ncbi:MAG: HAD family hydrolase [Fuerstiella sp.]